MQLLNQKYRSAQGELLSLCTPLLRLFPTFDSCFVMFWRFSTLYLTSNPGFGWKLSTELMLLGFISLLLTATSSIISNICIPSKFYDSAFAPCTKREVDEEREISKLRGRGLLMAFFDSQSHRRMLNALNQNTCREASKLRYNIIRMPFVFRLLHQFTINSDFS